MLEPSFPAHWPLLRARLSLFLYFVTEDVAAFISGGRREALESVLELKIRRKREFIQEVVSSPESRSV
jgi:hypothetical protein